MNVTPYLFLDGRAEEAIKFYQRALGAEVGMMMRFKESPDGQPGSIPAGSGEKIMHASISVGGHMLMLSDGNCRGKPVFQGVALSLGAGSDAEADKLFGALGEGGQIQMPMTSTFFASRFGMVADKFGVSWMVIHEKPRG